MSEVHHVTAARGPSIRWLAMAVVTIPLVTLAAILVVLSAYTGTRISRDLGESLVSSATDRVAGQVRTFLSHGVRVSELYEARLRSGSLRTGNLREWERAMLEDLAATPEVASIAFGGADGDATWLLRGAGRLEVGRVEGGHNDEAFEAVMSPDGLVSPTPIRVYHYDPRERPWYHIASSADDSRWTPTYFWFGEGGQDTTTGTGYATPIRRDGVLEGVLVVDVTLAGLSGFLSALPIAEDGWIGIVDEQGLMVAASRGAVVGADGARLALAAISEPAASGAIGMMSRGNLPGVSTVQRVASGGRAAIASVEPISPYPGIDWRVVAVLPEKAFLGDAGAMLTRSIVIAVVVSLLGVAIGWRLSQRVAAPLEKLAAHVRRVGAGEFDARIELRAAREFESLSSELNRMAGQLKDRIALEQSMAVAVAVQKSLLPAAAPQDTGLEIVGRTRYCDAAGGDYYDFIEAAEIASGRTLLAVGDVMGHGIGAALLMASARAALHAKAAEPGGLASAMNAVNRVLTAGAGHNQFMTMLLLVIDSERGEARWASAGHDPAIVHRPSTAAFFELEGGEVPLGVIEGQEFTEYSRNGLFAGDLVFVGTDGVWETMTATKEKFGKDRLRDVIRAHAAASCAEIATAIERTLDQFRGDAPRTDDVTFVIARIR